MRVKVNRVVQVDWRALPLGSERPPFSMRVQKILARMDLQEDRKIKVEQTKKENDET